MDKLKPRDLKQDDIDFLLSLKTDDITLDLGRSFFAYKKDKMPRFSPQDRFVLPKDSKFKNSTPIPTTVGRYIVNTFLFLEPNFIQFVGYQNTPLNKGGLGKVNAKLADLIVQDKISTKDFIIYLDKCHFMGYGWNDFLATSVNLDFINPNKEIRKFKKKVFEENKEEFSKEYVDIGQVIAAETKIIDFAKDQMKDNPAKEIFDAGSRGSFENNFKKTSLMIGGNRDLRDPDKFTVNLHNFAEGTTKKDLILLGNDMTDGSYSRGVLTAKGGYLSKQLWAAFQTIRKPTEKDCHSKRYQTITITKDNVDVLTFRYALIKGKLTETSIENLTPLIGTDVQFRSASFCISENICQTCMGTFLEKLDIEDPGLVINRVGSKVMMGMMKKFHDKSVKAKPYDLMSFINEVK